MGTPDALYTPTLRTQLVRGAVLRDLRAGQSGRRNEGGDQFDHNNERDFRLPDQKRKARTEDTTTMIEHKNERKEQSEPRHGHNPRRRNASPSPRGEQMNTGIDVRSSTDFARWSQSDEQGAETLSVGNAQRYLGMPNEIEDDAVTATMVGRNPNRDAPSAVCKCNEGSKCTQIFEICAR